MGTIARQRMDEDDPNSIAEEEPPLWCRTPAKPWAPLSRTRETAIILPFTPHECDEALVICIVVFFDAARGNPLKQLCVFSPAPRLREHHLKRP